MQMEVLAGDLRADTIESRPKGTPRCCPSRLRECLMLHGRSAVFPGVGSKAG